MGSRRGVQLLLCGFGLACAFAAPHALLKHGNITADFAWSDSPSAWHQQTARIVDHRFTTFAELKTFATNGKKAGVSVLMLVQLQASKNCPGMWYNGLQLCDHINGSYPVEDGSLEEWQEMLREIKPMRLMVWWNVDYWSVQGEVWKQAVADQTSDVGKWFSYGPTASSIPKCDGNNVCFKSGSTGQQVCAQGSWGSDGMYSGVQSALSSFGSPTYAEYLADAMANSWTRNLGIDGYTIDCSANYDFCMEQTKHAQNDFYNGIVGKVRETQPQVVMSGEGYGSWDEVISTNSQMGGQGSQNYHTAMQKAVFDGDASNLEGVASASGADAATVVCYLHPGLDGKQPGGCPTMYFRDTSATISDITQHRLWVTLEAASGIVSEHDFDPNSECHTTGPDSFNGCGTGPGQGAWWNVTNDPYEDSDDESPLWAFTKYRALNRLALRTKLTITSSSLGFTTAAVTADDSYTEYRQQNCYNGHGGIEYGKPTAVGSVAQCQEGCDADDACDCVVFYTATPHAVEYPNDMCWKRSNCTPTTFEKDAATAPFSVYVKNNHAPPANKYEAYPQQNCYNGHGGIEYGEPKDGVSIEQCKAMCDANEDCSCVVYDTAKTCWKRTSCAPKQFEKDSATIPFSVYVKRGWIPPPPPPKVAGGALAYLKHDAMGPQGDAAIVVFNPGAAQNVTIDLSSLPASLTDGNVTPYDLFSNDTATVPLSKSWKVSMRAGEAKAFGGFHLGVYAPHTGKSAGCDSGYSRHVGAATLEACFMECASDSHCKNVFVHGDLPRYMEAPPPITCTLLGAVADPSTACKPGSCNTGDSARCGTLISQLPHARSCADRWATPTPLATGAPVVRPGPPCPQ